MKIIEVGFTDVFIHFKSKVCVDGPTEVCNPPICADGPRTILNPGMANDFMSGQGAVPIGPRILGNEGNAGLTKAGFDIVEFDGQNSTFVDWNSIMDDPFNLDLIASAKERHLSGIILQSYSREKTMPSDFSALKLKLIQVSEKIRKNRICHE